MVNIVLWSPHSGNTCVYSGGIKFSFSGVAVPLDNTGMNKSLLRYALEVSCFHIKKKICCTH